MGVGRNYVLDLPMVVTEAITKHEGVKLGTAEQTIDAADTLGEACLGIAQETATAADATNGRVIAVAVLGTAVAEAGAAVAIGVNVYVEADGQLITVPGAQTNANRVGVALTATSAAGEWFTVLLTPYSQIDT